MDSYCCYCRHYFDSYCYHKHCSVQETISWYACHKKVGSILYISDKSALSLVENPDVLGAVLDTDYIISIYRDVWLAGVLKKVTGV